jgi:hypothetical protein
VDVIEGTGREVVVWRLQLHVIDVKLEDERVICHTADGRAFAIDLEFPKPMSPGIATGRQSDAYGSAVERPVLVVSGTLMLPVTVRSRIRECK